MRRRHLRHRRRRQVRGHLSQVGGLGPSPRTSTESWLPSATDVNVIAVSEAEPGSCVRRSPELNGDRAHSARGYVSQHSSCAGHGRRDVVVAVEEPDRRTGRRLVALTLKLSTDPSFCNCTAKVQNPPGWIAWLRLWSGKPSGSLYWSSKADRAGGSVLQPRVGPRCRRVRVEGDRDLASCLRPPSTRMTHCSVTQSCPPLLRSRAASTPVLDGERAVVGRDERQGWLVTAPVGRRHLAVEEERWTDRIAVPWIVTACPLARSALGVTDTSGLGAPRCSASADTTVLGKSTTSPAAITQSGTAVTQSTYPVGGRKNSETLDIRHEAARCVSASTMTSTGADPQSVGLPWIGRALQHLRRSRPDGKPLPVTLTSSFPVAVPGSMAIEPRVVGGDGGGANAMGTLSSVCELK